MSAARIVDVNYHDFMSHLKAAADSGHRIEKTEKDRWTAFVREHRVLEASALSFARSRSESIRPVIIESGAWTGYYLYSTDDQIALRFERDG